MKLVLRKTGGAMDLSGLTAGPGDVAERDKFYGAGSDYVQTGRLKRNDVIKKKLGPNETYNVPTGIIPVGSYVYQDIPTRGGLTITPSASGGIAGIGGKYMTEDLTVLGVENLIPENIRAGATIGTVPGQWQGYVNNDELSPYWYGIFSPGQSGAIDSYSYAFSGNGGKYYVNWNRIPDGFDENHAISMRFGSEYGNLKGYDFYALTFREPIEMTGVKSISFCYRTINVYANERNRLVLHQSQGVPYGSDWNIRSEIGSYETFNIAPSEGKWSVATFQISKANLYHYMHFGIGIAPTTSTGRYMDIIWIKLNK